MSYSSVYVHESKHRIAPKSGPVVNATLPSLSPSWVKCHSCLSSCEDASVALLDEPHNVRLQGPDDPAKDCHGHQHLEWRSLASKELANDPENMFVSA